MRLYLRLVISLLPYASGLLAQEEAGKILNNMGDPMKVAYACAEDELEEAGLLCTEREPCSIFLELTAIASGAKKIHVAGDLHATSGTLSSVLLSSEDGGLTWKETAPRVRGAAIDQVQFQDAEHGWAAGEIQYPLPRDPFFLISSDGGKSWRRRPVSEDGGSGSIQRFWFDSAQHGELVIDAGRSAEGGRYRDYESETGGDSWMIRAATDQAPKIKRAPPLSDDVNFRIRPAPGGKSYRIERREGEKWELVASFLIEVASCRVKSPELKEPPPDSGLETEPQPAKDYVEEIHLGDPSTVSPKKSTPKRKGSRE